MATIYQVAAKSGVSAKTAARILAGESKRSKSRERVLKAAKDLGYVRNQQAANLRSGASNLLGVIVPSIANVFFLTYIQSIHTAARQYGYDLLFFSTFNDPDEETRALRNFAANRVSGIIINASENEAGPEFDGVVRQLLSRNTPVIMGGRRRMGLPVDLVRIAQVDAVERVVTYLIRAGHRELGFVGGKPDTFSTDARLGAFKAVLQKAGIPVREDWLSFGDFHASSAEIRAKSILSRPKRPTAIVAANDAMAIGVIRACCDLGLRVPEDVAVTGFDDTEIASLIIPRLTTVRQPHAAIAEDCVRLLVERIKAKDVSNPRVLEYQLELILRESA